MANTLKIKRGTAATIPQGQLAEPLFTTDTYDLYIGKGSGGNQRIQNYIASGTSSQFLKGDGTLDSTSYQPLITAGTTLQYYRGDKTFQTLDTSVVPENGPIYFTEPRVRATVLTGLNLSGGGTIAATDSILTAFGKVQNQISALVGGATYQGTWNASTNTPTLASGTGTKGYYYVVSVAGSTNLDGITDWKIGDWAIFNGTTWDKVDNTDAVSSVNGFTGAVNLGLDNISDVSAASPTNAQFLRFNGTNSLWENYTLTSGDIPSGSNNYIQNNATATAQNAKFYIGTGNRIDNSTNTDGIYLANSGIGNGYRVANSSTGSGIVIDNSSGGTGILVGNTSTGSGIVVDNSTAATGYLFRGAKNAVNKILMDDSGNITAASYIKSGGTSSQFLKADGSLDSSTYVTGGPYLPLTGGTLTGALSGTNATFSSTILANDSIRALQTTTSGSIQIITDADNGTSLRAALITFGSTATDSLLGIARASNSMLYKDGGKLAIGTRAAHDLVLSTNDSVRLTIASTGAATFNSSVTIGAGTAFNWGARGGISQDASWNFSWSTNSVANAFYLQSATGNVGIGGTNTDSLLTVNGTAGTSHERFREGSTTVGFVGGANGIITGHNGKLALRAESGLILSGTGNSPDVIIASGGAATFSSSVTATAFIPTGSTVPTNGMYLSAANTLSLSTNSTRAITISDGQKVGIGADPISAYRLYVNGDVYASGTVYGSIASFTSGGTFGGSISATGGTFSGNVIVNTTTFAQVKINNAATTGANRGTSFEVNSTTNAGTTFLGQLNAISNNANAPYNSTDAIYLMSRTSGIPLIFTTNNGGTEAERFRIASTGATAIQGNLSANSPAAGNTGEGIIAGTSFKIDATGTSQSAKMYVVTKTLSDTYGSAFQIQFANSDDNKGFGYNINTSGGYETYVKDSGANWQRRMVIAQGGDVEIINNLTANSYVSKKGTQSTANATWTTVYTIPQTTAAQGIYYVYAHYLDGVDGMAFIQILADRTYRRSINGSNGATVSVRLDGNNIQVYQSYGVTLNIDWSILIQKLL